MFILSRHKPILPPYLRKNFSPFAARLARGAASGLALISLLCGCDVAPQEPIKIGFIGCFNGKCSDLGTAGRDGVQLAIDEINQNGGFQNAAGNKQTIQLITANLDVSEPPEEVKNDFRRLVEQGVVAAIGPMTSQAGSILKSEADATGTVLLAPTVSTTRLSRQDDNFFRVYPTCDITATALAKYAVGTVALKSFAIVYNEHNGAFVDPWIDYFRSEVVASGGRIIGVQPLNEALPSMVSAKRINELNPDGILIIDNAYNTGLFMQQLAKLGNRAKIFGTEWSTSKGLPHYAGRALNGASFIASFDESGQQPDNLHFSKDFQSRYGKEPSFAAKFSYEATKLLVAALSKRSAEPFSLKQALTTLGPLPGLQNMLEFDDYGDVKRNVYITQFRDGAYRTVAKHVNGNIELLESETSIPAVTAD